MKPAAFLAISGVIAVAGCELERSEGLGEGELHMVVVDDDGDAVEGALVSVLATGVGAISDADGAAVVAGLGAGDYAFRVSVDDDGDGVADRAAVRGDATVRVGEVRGLARLTAFELESPVTLAATGSVSGSVTGCADGEVCRVVAFRRIQLGTAFSTAIREVALPVEGQSGVQADGTWRIEGLAPGEVQLLALAATASTSVEPRQQLIAASQPSRFGVGVADVGDSGVALSVDDAVPAGVEATIEVAGTDAVGLAGDAFVNAPSDIVGLEGGGDVGAIAEDARDVVVTVPVSVFDVAVQLEGVQGDLRAAAAIPNIGRLLPINPILTPCAKKLPSDDDAACTVYCDADSDGLLDADPAEEDADGDGVADVDEVGCVGVNVGTDADGDCLCDVVDPFPGCSSNDPADCTRAIPVVCGE